MVRNNWIVSAEEEGMTLLSFLRAKHASGPSVKAMKRLIDAKQCTVDGRVETFSSHPLKKGAKVVLNLKVREKKPFHLEILYEDADLFIVNKPAGIVCTNQSFQAHFKHAELAHRLDKETSGALILVKNTEMKETMRALFAKRKVEKTYLALVDGEVVAKKGTIDNFLGPKSHYSGQTVYHAVKQGKGLRAITDWVCMHKGKKASLLLCQPQTGRTHQLRVHLSSIGHPILGDAQYGAHFKCSLRPCRHLLHAYAVRFSHPRTQKRLEVVAPIPLDFKEALKVVSICL